MNFEIALLDGGVGPNALDQLIFADDFASTFHEGRQKPKRASPQSNSLAGVQQQSLVRQEDEGSECNATFG